MWQVFIGSLFLSVIHALIPNHWIPLVTVSKTGNWTRRETYLATFVSGFSHTASTILIGIAIGLIGFRLSEAYAAVTRIAAPVILLLMGLIYLILDIRNNLHGHRLGHTHGPSVKQNRNSRWAVIASLSLAMFLTPCTEIEAYYFQAGTQGWPGILLVSAVYLTVTLLVMFLLVFLGLRGIDRFNVHFLEHHEKGITGVVLVVLAVLAWFVEF